MAEVLRVLVVDDQQILRRGLVMLLGTVEGVSVVAEAAHGAEALAVLARHPVDVVLADARMPTMDGVELVRRCADLHPGLPVMILTTFDDTTLVRDAVGAGAAGFLLKDTSVDELTEALRAVAAGGLVLDPRVARHALTPPDQEAPVPAVLAALTPTETRVARLVAQGLDNTTIAARTHLAEGTVKNHVSALLRKTGSADRTVLALRVYQALQDLEGDTR